jgi:hypothetical protein
MSLDESRTLLIAEQVREHGLSPNFAAFWSKRASLRLTDWQLQMLLAA